MLATRVSHDQLLGKHTRAQAFVVLFGVDKWFLKWLFRANKRDTVSVLQN